MNRKRERDPVVLFFLDEEHKTILRVGDSPLPLSAGVFSVVPDSG